MRVIATLGRRTFWLAFIAVALGCALTPAIASARPPIALGVNIANAPADGASLENYVATARRAPAIVMWYQQWSEPLFYSSQLPNVARVGAIPMITWDPTLNGAGIPLSAIVKGRYDGYIRAAATSAAAWKGPIYIRLAHEMNLRGTAFGPGHQGDTPATFIAAWRHIVGIFRRQHATNVEWVWSPNVDCGGACRFTPYYPGNAWVDWVALDGYNYAGVDHLPWESFSRIFHSSYVAITKLSPKPVMIAETASSAVGGNKAKWISQTFARLAVNYPRLHAVVWFDRKKETDWRVTSGRASLHSWRAVVTSRQYAGTSSTLLSLMPLKRDADADPVAYGVAKRIGEPSGLGPTRRTERHVTGGRSVSEQVHETRRAIVATN